MGPSKCHKDLKGGDKQTKKIHKKTTPFNDNMTLFLKSAFNLHTLARDSLYICILRCVCFQGSRASGRS